MTLCVKELNKDNEEQQRLLGYEKFDSYYSIFEQSILQGMKNDGTNKDNAQNQQILAYEKALGALKKKLENKVDHISEEVWEVLKVDFNTSVVSGNIRVKIQ